MKLTGLELVFISIIVIVQPVVGPWIGKKEKETTPPLKPEIKEVVELSETHLREASPEDRKKAADIGYSVFSLPEVFDATPELLELLASNWNAVLEVEKTGPNANKNERAFRVLKYTCEEICTNYARIIESEFRSDGRKKSVSEKFSEIRNRMPIEFNCYRQQVMKKSDKSADAKTILSKHINDFYKKTIAVEEKEAAKIEKAIARQKSVIANRNYIDTY